MESVRVASAEAGVGTYDYVFDGDNLAFIIMQHYGVKNTITTLYANPSDKVIGFRIGILKILVHPKQANISRLRV